jgi:4-amino-4-deoxy-L-arabinose transferase-like glycosyltransferase
MVSALAARWGERHGPAAAAAPKRMLGGVDLVLVGLLLVALVVRVWGITWQLPWVLHADEHHYAGRALRMWATKDPNPHWFINPTLLTYWLAAQYVPFRGALYLALVLPKELGFSAGLVETPYATARLLGEYLIGRVNSAVLGAATVWATYSLGRILLERRAALVAAAFLALDFLHVRNSHYATNDVAATFLLVVSCIYAARLAERPGTRTCLLVGLFGGLATGTKYSMGFFLAPLVVGHVLAWRRQALSRPALLLLLLAGVTSGLGFFATNPYTLLDWQAFLAGFQRQYNFGGSLWSGQEPGPTPLLWYLLTLVQGMGYLQVLLVLLGLGTGILRGHRGTLLLSAFPLAYLLFMATKPLFFVRFAMPLLPFLCLLAAYGGGVLATNLAAVTRRPVLAFALAVVAVLQPAIAIVRHNLILTREDTRVLAARWAMNHIAGLGAITVYDPAWDGDLLTLPTPMGGWPVGRRLEFTPDLPAARPYNGVPSDSGTARFLVVSSFVRDPKRITALVRGSEWPDSLDRRWEEQVARAERLAIFTPGVDGGSIPFRRDDAYTPFWDLAAWARPGPTVVIYKLPR